MLNMIELEEVIVELSFNCNLSCIMCGFGKDVNPVSKEKFLSFENYKRILEKIGDKTKSIRLNGRGESTIHPEFVKIVDYTRSTFPYLKIILFSNFSFKKKEIIDSFIKYNIQLFVSFDSPFRKELEYIRKGAKYNYIINNLEKLKKSEPTPFIIFTIQETNYNRIFNMAEFAFKYNCNILYNTIRRDYGIERFIDIVKNNIDFINEQFEKGRQLYSKTNLQFLFPDQLAGIRLFNPSARKTHASLSCCPSLNKEICILHDGTVTACNMFNPYEYGNIFNESLDEIWEGNKRKAFLRDHRSHYYCKNCANLGM
jgi:radical SAM protein with 4Fe4S-binding SPASM domain